MWILIFMVLYNGEPVAQVAIDTGSRNKDICVAIGEQRSEVYSGQQGYTFKYGCVQNEKT